MKNTILKYWQPLYILLATSWLFAPVLNDLLVHRLTLISEYEAPGQPYSYLFRVCDVLGGLLLLVVVNWLAGKDRGPAYWLISIVAIGSMIDALAPTSCLVTNHICTEQKTSLFIVHATETVITSGAIVLAGIYDWIKRQAMPSKLFVLLQAVYGALALSTIVTGHEALLQYSYQLTVVTWLAWFVQSKWGSPIELSEHSQKIVRVVASVWAAVSGTASILLSFEHLKDQRLLDHLYFGSSTPWLAQHTVIVGVVLLYISRHLYRGELRARQIFLVLAAIEICKYAVVGPNALVLTIYLGSYVVLFAASSAFKRRTATLDLHDRLIDILIIVSCVAIATLAGGYAFSHSQREHAAISRVDSQYIKIRSHIPKERYEKVTDNDRFTDVMETLLVVTVLFVLVSLFQPKKAAQSDTSSDRSQARQLLTKYSSSSEDYFKLWPEDKQYFWTTDTKNFVAYKVVRSVAFALADPIGPSPQRALQEFTNYCRESGWKACFMLVSDADKSMYEKAGYNTLKIGASAEVEIEDFVTKTIRNKWWRWQVNKNTKAGYEFTVSSPPHSNELLGKLESVSDLWLERPGHREQGFALGYFDRDYLNQCEICYLTIANEVVAFANLMPVFADLNRATIDLMRFNPEHQGVMSYLLASTIQHVGDSASVFDLGFVPFAGSKSTLTRIVKLLGRQRFSAAGLAQFKNKFEPNWQDNYIAYDGDLIDSGIIAANLEEVLRRP